MHFHIRRLSNRLDFPGPVDFDDLTKTTW